MLLAAILAALLAALFAADTMAAGSPQCAQRTLIECSTPLRQLTHHGDLTFVSTKKELDIVCPNLNSGLMCIENYTRRCMSEEQRKHFHRLYAGTTMVIEDLCREGPYQMEFLSHAPCMRKARKEYESCAEIYQQRIQELQASVNISTDNLKIVNEDQMRKVCCSFQDYLLCSTNIVKEICGEETARFTQMFLDRMSASLKRIHCDRYPVGSLICNPEDAEQLSGGVPAVLPLSPVLALLLLIVPVLR